MLVIALGSADGGRLVALQEQPVAVPALGSGSLAGKVTLLRGGVPLPSAAGVVLYLPGVSRRSEAVFEDRRVMTSRGKTFVPHVLAVPEGTTVEFPNVDKIHHNAFSLSDNCRFDLGLYKNGASRSKTFDAAGVCRVYCNIHVQMSAIVLVTKGDAAAATGPDGAYRIDDLPPGRHTLRVWHEKGAPLEEPVEVAAGRTSTRDFHIDVTTFKATPHTRKDGTAYGKDDDVRY